MNCKTTINMKTKLEAISKYYNYNKTNITKNNEYD